MFQNRRYYILDSTEQNKIDYDSILVKESDRVRKSLDSTKCLISIEGSSKPFLNTISSLEGPYTHQEIKVIIKQPEWFKS
jgi:hypothetical protein